MWFLSFQITIVIDDVNDEKPYFIGDYDTPISVPENTAEKRGLIIMKARDDDASRKLYSFSLLVVTVCTGRN
jgi:hypothetical protein